MKTDRKNIELIHNYLDKSLNHDEIEIVEYQLQSDIKFQDLYKEQLTLIQGIKRAGLKEEVRRAKKSHCKLKKLKVLGISVSFIAVIILVSMTFFKTSQIKTPKSIIKNNKVEVLDTDTDLVKKTELGGIKVLKDSAVVGVDIIEKPLKEKTLITPQELKDETERVKVKESEKAQEYVKITLDTLSLKKKPQVISDKTEKVLSRPLKKSTTLNIHEIAFRDKLIGTYEMKLEASNALIIDNLTLNQNGTFEFHEYDKHDLGIPPERNTYAKGTWKIEKNLILFSTSDSDFDEKYTLDFNNTKARCIKKSSRDTSDRDIKTSIKFYESEIFWIPNRTLLKME